MGERTKWLVSTQWLETHLDSPDVVVLDGSWYLPHEQRDPEAEYRAEHIPGSFYFDMDAIADLSTDLPHMLPTASDFSAAVQTLGISDGQKIVIYDGVGLRSSPRIWWTFRTMGVQDVCILDGGLPKWKAEGRPLSDLVPTPHVGRFSARLDHGSVRSYDDVLKAVNTQAIQIVDARSEERWLGQAPEPRPNIPSGRFPGSKNVPFPDLVDENGCLRDIAALRQRFIDAGVDLDKPVITSCGSGATAAILTLALDTIGHGQLGLYDGSWAEWASREGSPIDCEPGAPFGPNGG
ncbi:3-mercaptopyruvate sulfurtransferase [Cohaesibacter celericrescens]|uniref:3-mercaptopyruvate sulfurtransferase n=1 Tax=Cohaesibacter celericrescens TaxID=2067669 RepID=A0A2N5XU12_9HYPH|nr:3-mercaptopyruvate sulfurtransferase [Cohaesibacter celericrescens]PLW77935.1 3-mercaptopyruvate sulfurtransferase [Cohaesibacter celericrescens]